MESTKIEALATAFALVANTTNKVDAKARWTWSKSLSSELDALADNKARNDAAKLLGEAIGAQLHRAPYSQSWVKNHVNAYKAFTAMPDSPDECQKFLNVCNGNNERNAEEKKPNAKPANPMKRLSNLVIKLLGEGFSEETILGCVNGAIAQAK